MNKENLLVKKLQAIGDESRMKIMKAIWSDPDMCVSELSGYLGLNIAIVSHHLHVLSKAGFLMPRRNGKKICYRVCDSNLNNKLKSLIINK